jgi:hypothetical protein
VGEIGVIIDSTECPLHISGAHITVWTIPDMSLLCHCFVATYEYILVMYMILALSLLTFLLLLLLFLVIYAPCHCLFFGRCET